MAEGSDDEEETLQIAELDDVEEKAYIFGLNLHDDEDAEEWQHHLDRLLVNAGVMMVDLPMEGQIEIIETDRQELHDVLDYRDVMGDLDG